MKRTRINNNSESNDEPIQLTPPNSHTASSNANGKKLIKLRRSSQNTKVCKKLKLDDSTLTYLDSTNNYCSYNHDDEKISFVPQPLVSSTTSLLDIKNVTIFKYALQRTSSKVVTNFKPSVKKTQESEEEDAVISPLAILSKWYEVADILDAINTFLPYETIIITSFVCKLWRESVRKLEAKLYATLQNSSYYTTEFFYQGRFLKYFDQKLGWSKSIFCEPDVFLKTKKYMKDGDFIDVPSYYKSFIGIPDNFIKDEFRKIPGVIKSIFTVPKNMPNIHKPFYDDVDNVGAPTSVKKCVSFLNTVILAREPRMQLIAENIHNPEMIKWVFDTFNPFKLIYTSDLSVIKPIVRKFLVLALEKGKEVLSIRYKDPNEVFEKMEASCTNIVKSLQIITDTKNISKFNPPHNLKLVRGCYNHDFITDSTEAFKYSNKTINNWFFNDYMNIFFPDGLCEELINYYHFDNIFTYFHAFERKEQAKTGMHVSRDPSARYIYWSKTKENRDSFYRSMVKLYVDLILDNPRTKKRSTEKELEFILNHDLKFLRIAIFSGYSISTISWLIYESGLRIISLFNSSLLIHTTNFNNFNSNNSTKSDTKLCSNNFIHENNIDMLFLTCITDRPSFMGPEEEKSDQCLITLLEAGIPPTFRLIIYLFGYYKFKVIGLIMAKYLVKYSNNIFTPENDKKFFKPELLVYEQDRQSIPEEWSDDGQKWAEFTYTLIAQQYKDNSYSLRLNSKGIDPSAFTVGEMLNFFVRVVFYANTKVICQYILTKWAYKNSDNSIFESIFNTNKQLFYDESHTLIKASIGDLCTMNIREICPGVSVFPYIDAADVDIVHEATGTYVANPTVAQYVFNILKNSNHQKLDLNPIRNIGTHVQFTEIPQFGGYKLFKQEESVPGSNEDVLMLTTREYDEHKHTHTSCKKFLIFTPEQLLFNLENEFRIPSNLVCQRLDEILTNGVFYSPRFNIDGSLHSSVLKIPTDNYINIGILPIRGVIEDGKLFRASVLAFEYYIRMLLLENKNKFTDLTLRRTAHCIKTSREETTKKISDFPRQITKLLGDYPSPLKYAKHNQETYLHEKIISGSHDTITLMLTDQSCSTHLALFFASFRLYIDLLFKRLIQIDPTWKNCLPTENLDVVSSEMSTQLLDGNWDIHVFTYNGFSSADRLAALDVVDKCNNNLYDIIQNVENGKLEEMDSNSVKFLTYCTMNMYCPHDHVKDESFAHCVACSGIIENVVKQFI